MPGGELRWAGITGSMRVRVTRRGGKRNGERKKKKKKSQCVINFKPPGDFISPEFSVLE